MAFRNSHLDNPIERSSLSVPAPFPEFQPPRPLKPPLGLPTWGAAGIAFLVLSFVPLINFAVWIGAGFWVVNRWNEAGSGPRLLANFLAGTKLAEAFHKEGSMELVDSEVGPVLRIENTKPDVSHRNQSGQVTSRTPLVLHLELLTGAWTPVLRSDTREPVVLKTWFKPWIDQPAFLVPLAPFDLDDADRDGLAVRIKVQLKDALMPGQFTAKVPGGFLDQAARRPPEPKVEPGLDHDLLPHDICPVCAKTLEGEVVTCQACGASQHAKCLGLTGICPGFGCG